MERKKWADDSESEGENAIENKKDLLYDIFALQYKNLQLPISLHIKNISFNCNSDEEISAWFNSQINSQVSVKRNLKKEMFRGDAKVIVNSLELAYNVLQFSGKEYLGRPLEIRILETLPQNLKPTHRSNKSINILFTDRKYLFQHTKTVATTVPTNAINRKKPNPFGDAKPVDTLSKDIEFESTNKIRLEDKAKRLEELDPSIISLKLKLDSKTKPKSRRTQSNFDIFSLQKYISQ